jgi:hypothetical protein
MRRPLGDILANPVETGSAHLALIERFKAGRERESLDSWLSVE